MNRPDAKSVSISLRLEAAVAEKLYANASATGSSVSELIRESIAKANAAADTESRAA